MYYTFLKFSRYFTNKFFGLNKHKFLFILTPPYCGSTLLNQILSTSKNFGFKPAWTKGQRDVDQHKAGITKVLPDFNLFFFFGFNIAKDYKRFADQTELTISAYLDPTYFANAFSNFFVMLDIVIFLLNKTSAPEKISSFVKPFSNKG